MAILAADGVDADGLKAVHESLESEGAICEVLAPHGGTLRGGVEVDRGLLTMASVLFDAVFVPGGRESVDTLRGNGAAVRYVAEAYKHAKPVGAIGEGVEMLRDAPLNGARLSDNGLVDDAGVVTLAAPTPEEARRLAEAFVAAIAEHRHFDRDLEAVPA